MDIIQDFSVSGLAKIIESRDEIAFAVPSSGWNANGWDQLVMGGIDPLTRVIVTGAGR